MKAIQIISQDLFDKIRSRFSNLEMGDETGAVTIDPVQARFFDFDFVKEGIDLGRVSVSIADAGSLKIYYSQGITEGQDDIGKHVWYDFLKEMRMFAKRRLLRFDTRDIAKNNLDRNDFQHLAATQAPKEDEMALQMNESRWTTKSSKKTSRAVKGATEVIVRHNRPVEETYPGARSQRKNIKAIFIQNREGERFKYPFIHPAGAFAMAQHVDHGGVPHDPAGKAIIRMSEQIAQLQEFQKKVQHQTLHDDATGISERAIGRLQELKGMIEALSKRHYYESWIAEFDESQEPMIGELDAVTLETYKQAFTQTSFNEELAGLFPLIHSIMQEKVDLEEYVADKNNEEILGTLAGGALGAALGGPLGALQGAAAGDSLTDPDADEVDKEGFSKFEAWADAIEEGTLTPDQIESLKLELDNMVQSGQKLDFQTAYEFFQQFGIDDPQLEKDFQAQADLDASVDPLKTFRDWATDSYPDLLGPLSAVLPQDEQPQTAPVEPAPAEQPTAENDDQQWTNNMMSKVSEGQNMDEVYHRVAEMVKSRFNRDNPNVGPFNGQEGILLDVEKEIKEKYGEEVGVHARTVAEKFMERLTQKWAAKHKPAVMGEKDNEETPHSHQAQTTLKHLKNKTYGDRADAANIKPGVKGFKDRYDMLQRAKDTGNLKGDGDVEEAKYQKVSAQQKFKNSMKRAGYDMDAGAKRLQDLLDKQKKEREEKEKKDMAEGAKWRKHPDAYDVDDEGNKTPRNPNSSKFGYDPLQRRADTANDAKTSKGKVSALKTSLKMAKGQKDMAEERTEVKDKDGKVVSWRDEGEWKKVPTKKDPRGKVTNLSDKARRETEKMNPVKEEMERILKLSGLAK